MVLLLFSFFSSRYNIDGSVILCEVLVMKGNVVMENTKMSPWWKYWILYCYGYNCNNRCSTIRVMFHDWCFNGNSKCIDIVNRFDVTSLACSSQKFLVIYGKKSLWCIPRHLELFFYYHRPNRDHCRHGFTCRRRHSVHWGIFTNVHVSLKPKYKARAFGWCPSGSSRLGSSSS